MENNPQVAVMMPVYNGEKTLSLAISSLQKQTYPFWKCYIVNDGSTDGTKEILDGLTDPRFVIIHFEQNKGRPYARQAALNVAEGEYLVFLDADDFYHPEKLEFQVGIMREFPNIFLVSCIMASFDNNYELRSVRPMNGFTKPKKYDFRKEFTPSRAGSLVLLDHAKSIQYDLTLEYAEDTDFFSRYLKDKEYLVLNKVLYYYSEFESVTKQKILETYKYKFLRTQKKIRFYPIKVSIDLIKILLKWFLIYIVLIIKGHEFLLKKRGSPATPEDIEVFNVNYIKIRN